MTPKLLAYHQISGVPITPPLWVAIVEGSPGAGGLGVVLAGEHQSRHTRGRKVPGGEFRFGGNPSLNDRTSRELWGLDAAPPEIQAAWMKYMHLGLIPAT